MIDYSARLNEIALGIVCISEGSEFQAFIALGKNEWQCWLEWLRIADAL